ncbi:MAG: hypothetical protein ACLTDX_23085 [[Clostridium] innocuum]
MKVFEKNKLGHMELSNRIGVPAMCTYMVKTKDGVGNLHHVAHYDTLAKGRPAFIVQEATAVNAHGYINDACLGIFTPRQRQILKDIVDCVHAYGVNIGIQLNHAGMKNTFGNQKYGPMEQGDVISLDEDGINELIVNFEFASRWARELGYDFVEVHAAHGYLINQFLSPAHQSAQRCLWSRTVPFCFAVSWRAAGIILREISWFVSLPRNMKPVVCIRKI